MTQLHLDTDEWDNILHALKAERKRAPKKERPYCEYLDSIISKVECALAVTPRS